jgi:hypothetical protein
MSITVGSTILNSATQSLDSFFFLPLGSIGGGVGSLGTSLGSVVASPVGSIDLIPGIDNWESVIGALAGGVPGGLLGGSAGLFIDSVSGLGTSLGILGAPGVGSLGALAASVAGGLAGIGGILSMLMGASGLGTALPAGILTSAPNSLISFSQLFGG